MNTDYLKAYVEKEFATVKQLAAQVGDAKGTIKHDLCSLYGLTTSSKIVYAESGGLLNFSCLPQDTTLIIPIFPWSEDDLQKIICPVHQLQKLVETGRVFPIIQNPLCYEGYEHLKFLFETGAPSYFIRGSFVYSAVLGISAEVTMTDEGYPLLSAINKLMTYCDKTHDTWIKYAKENQDCWEYRYRKQSIRDNRFYNDMHSSLCYRYASVAMCIGKHNADLILSTFPPLRASEILLHLHILFDHIMCHGLGSNFVVHPNTPDGKDFNVSKKTGITRPHEWNIIEGLCVTLPEEKSEYVECLLKEEHFLREINFSLVTRESISQIQNQLNRQFSAFNKNVEKVSKGKKLTQVSVQVTLYILSVAAMLDGKPTSGVAGFISGFKVPWLANAVANSLEKMYRDRLTSYIFDLNVGKH